MPPFSTHACHAPHDGTSAFILVVEDDRSVADALDLLLRHYGYDVCVAPTLADARSCLASGRRPAVIVLDLNLPDGLGLDLLDQIRSNPASAAARVVVLTADVNPDHLRTLKRLQPQRFLRKPMNFLDLLEAVRGELAAAAAARAA